MAKKLDNKKLLGVLVILALIFFVTEYLRDNERGNVELPTRVIGLGGDSSVTEFTIYPEGEKGEILFSKDADSWYVEANGLKGEAEKTSVESMIDQIMAAKPSRLVAKTKEKWEKYLLTDSLASRISFKRGEEVINLYVGKFSYSQEPGYAQGGQPNFKVSTYVRLHGGDEIYAIDEGFWASGLKRDFNAWRKADFLSLDKESITEIRFNYPEDQFLLKKIDSTWLIDGEVSNYDVIEGYLGTLANRQQRNFADRFVADTPADYTIIFSGLNMSNVTVTCWIDKSDEKQYYFNSSQNQLAYFKGNSDDLFKELIKSREEFLAPK